LDKEFKNALIMQLFRRKMVQAVGKDVELSG
jgi:hypothetical protein